MKVAGIVIAAVGTLFAVLTFTLSAAMDDLGSEEGLSQLLEGVGVWSAVALVGVALFAVGASRSSRKGP